ncbi:MAG: hypothetical protein MUP03_03700 [Anaerolineales bacterium]|nr:hypothetical protein [Anaerolineales bacterium]
MVRHVPGIPARILPPVHPYLGAGDPGDRDSDVVGPDEGGGTGGGERESGGTGEVEDGIGKEEDGYTEDERFKIIPFISNSHRSPASGQPR